MFFVFIFLLLLLFFRGGGNLGNEALRTEKYKMLVSCCLLALASVVSTLGLAYCCNSNQYLGYIST